MTRKVQSTLWYDRKNTWPSINRFNTLFVLHIVLQSDTMRGFCVCRSFTYEGLYVLFRSSLFWRTFVSLFVSTVWINSFEVKLPKTTIFPRSWEIVDRQTCRSLKIRPKIGSKKSARNLAWFPRRQIFVYFGPLHLFLRWNLFIVGKSDAIYNMSYGWICGFVIPAGKSWKKRQHCGTADSRRVCRRRGLVIFVLFRLDPFWMSCCWAGGMRQARTFRFRQECFVPSVHFLPEYNLNLII